YFCVWSSLPISIRGSLRFRSSFDKKPPCTPSPTGANVSVSRGPSASSTTPYLAGCFLMAATRLPPIDRAIDGKPHNPPLFSDQNCPSFVCVTSQPTYVTLRFMSSY
ncbi:unnamed protein product, partial [Ectocarpus sp. 13 AM-2016]